MTSSSTMLALQSMLQTLFPGGFTARGGGGGSGLTARGGGGRRLTDGGLPNPCKDLIGEASLLKLQMFHGFSPV